MTGMKKEELMQNLYGPVAGKKIEVVELDLDQISDHHNHTFKIAEDDTFTGLVQSFIVNDKAIDPIIVRVSDKHGNPYECIEGHRRRRAARKAGKSNIWSIIVDMDDDEADIWMVDSNINNRLISLTEECQSVAAKYAAIKRQGKRGGRSDEQIAAEQGMSRGRVQDLLKLSRLTEEMLSFVEEGLITKQIGKILAEMSKDKQAKVSFWAFRPVVSGKPFKITPDQAEEIVTLSKSDDFSEKNVKAVYSSSGDLMKKAETEKKPAVFKLTDKDLAEVFPSNYTGDVADKIALIKKLLSEHFDTTNSEQ
jgi:ParB family chromosome partitioning protein